MGAYKGVMRVGKEKVGSSAQSRLFTVSGGQKNVNSQEIIFGEPPIVSNLLKVSKVGNFISDKK